MYWGRHNKLFAHGKTFHRVFTAVDRDRITSEILYHAVLILTACYMLTVSLKIVLSNLPFERLAFSESSSAVTLFFHADWMRVEQTAWLLLLSSWNPGRGCWSLRKLHFENYLAVSTWILNGSSIECHENKHQSFSSAGVRFGSRAIQISGLKSAWRWSGRK